MLLFLLTAGKSRANEVQIVLDITAHVAYWLFDREEAFRVFRFLLSSAPSQDFDPSQHWHISSLFVYQAGVRSITNPRHKKIQGAKVLP